MFWKRWWSSLPSKLVRHTFLTRPGESGCDAWTLARIAQIQLRRCLEKGVGSPCKVCPSQLSHFKGAVQKGARFKRSGAEAANSIKTKEKYGGRDRDRTGDPCLQRLVGPRVNDLHQLRYFAMRSDQALSFQRL
jgi:hypothetical protein